MSELEKKWANVRVAAGRRSWLFEAYRKNSIPPSHWEDLTRSIFNEIEATIAHAANGKVSVDNVPTVGTLTASAAGSIGSNADWLNEIHPNMQGWNKMAKVWHGEIKNPLP